MSMCDAKSMLLSGTLEIKFAGFGLSCQTTEADFLASAIGGEAKPLVHNGEWRSYYTEPVEILGRRFVLDVYFLAGGLESFSLSAVQSNLGWDAYDEGALKSIKSENDKWLRDRFGLGEYTRFQWGAIESVVEMKSPSARIVVSFRPAMGAMKSTRKK